MIQLMKSLIEKNALDPNTIITAYHLSKDIYGRIQRRSDQFTLLEVIKHPGSSRLRLCRIEDKHTVTVNAEDIVALDGMNPNRFLDIYNLNPDGTTKKTGKKRGRKTKIPST